MIYYCNDFLSKEECDLFLTKVQKEDVILKEKFLLDRIYDKSLELKVNNLVKPSESILSNSSYSDTENMHFDSSVEVIDDVAYVSPFLFLIYLNDCDGPLWFPIQDKIILPSAGKLVVIPTGSMYSHKVLPHGLDRPIIRTFCYVRTNITGIDAHNLYEQNNGLNSPY